MDSTAMLAGGAVVGFLVLEAYMRKYGQRHRAGGGVLKSDDSWMMASEYPPRPFYFNVDTQVLYRAIATQIITDEPLLSFTVRMEPVFSDATSLNRVIEPVFTSGFNPPRPANPFMTFFNEATTWYFSTKGPVSDEQMAGKRVEELEQLLALKEEELAQEKAERDAKIKDTFGMMSRLNRPPAPLPREELQ